MEAIENSILLNRGIADFIEKDKVIKKIEAGKKLRIKFGIDPTGFDLTIGHAVALRKLRQFQEAGHKIILLFGTFTAQIGDPTGKTATRKVLTKEEVLRNSETYLEQASKILNVDEIEVVYNGDWLEKLSFAEVLNLAGTFTVAQMLERDMFQERIKNKQEINLVEFLYPLMQGYDSVPIKSDIEIGGTDQLFNLHCGRPLQKKFGQEPQSVITVPLLVGTDGSDKMSKSLGNYIALNDSANDMFGKVMSIPDKAMEQYFELATNEDLKVVREKIAENPRDAKVWLAKLIIEFYHDQESAEKAEKNFIQKFVKKEIPDEMPEFKTKEATIGVLNLISTVCNFAESNSAARRLIKDGVVTWDGQKVVDVNKKIDISSEAKILQVGKKKFARILL